MTMTTNQAITFSVVVDWIGKIALPIVLAALTWTGTKIMDYEIRLTKIEATKFTANDAKVGFDNITIDLKSIQKDINTLNSKIDTQKPPQWLLDRINYLENEVDKLKNVKN